MWSRVLQVVCFLFHHDGMDTITILQHSINNFARSTLILYARGLLFAYHGLQKLHSDPTIELSDSFKQSYDTVLRRHYSFVTNGPVSVSAFPSCDIQNTHFHLPASPFSHIRLFYALLFIYSPIAHFPYVCAIIRTSLSNFPNLKPVL